MSLKPFIQLLKHEFLPFLNIYKIERYHMKKNSVISENIMTILGKIIAAFQIQRKIGDAMEKLPNDPKVRKAFLDYKASQEAAKISFINFCKLNPDHEKCKDRGESK